MREPPPELRGRSNATGASRVAAGLKSLWDRRWARVSVFSGGIGAFLSFVGAFGADQVPIIPRTAYFIAFGLYGGALGFAISGWTGRQRWIAERVWLRQVVIIFTMTFAMGLSVWASVKLLLPRGTSAGQLPTYLGISFVMSVALTALSFAVFRPTRVTHAAPAGAPPAKFLERLPIKLRGADLWAVEAEDHYLRLHTSRGEDLILMRLSDALGELEGLEGAQTHRSWWVAKAAVGEVKRGDGRATIVLPSAKEAPVSRTYARALREAGWL